MKNSIEERLQIIENRNKKVELDKSWETSWTRRITIVFLTYVVVTGYLTLIGNDQPFINGLVPAMGFLLSTLILKQVRNIWQK